MPVARKLVASRCVSEQMQEAFAGLSGDRNPMHMDAVKSRRTQAGQPVVHGVHTLLWSLESLVRGGLMATPIARVKVSFVRWAYVGEETELFVPAEPTENPRTLHVEVNGLSVLTAQVEYGAVQSPQPDGPESSLRPLEHALDLSFAEMDGRKGEAYVSTGASAAAMFPDLSRLLGARCVAEIAACSYVVGMEVPGLHSMFSKLDMSFGPGSQDGGLRFEVVYHDERFRKVRIGVAGGTLTGTVEAFLRVPPVAQATTAETAAMVTRGEFSAMRALIIGGSRGLGESTAKIVVAGGGEVAISYMLGKADAEELAREIGGWGGRATVLRYDVRAEAAEQLAALPWAPTHLFYFATGPIFKPQKSLFLPSRFAEFTQFYVRGFYDLCVAAMEPANAVEKMIVFYPSTVFVEERPNGMTEYAMVKAAGEQLCADMNRQMPGLHIVTSRLPRLQTDQTAGVLPERETSPMETLLPIAREMMRLGAR